MPETNPISTSSAPQPNELRSPFLFASSLTTDLPLPVWRKRLDSFLKPRVLISAFLATSAFYCFVIGRDRYTSVSEFVIQQAAPLQSSAASVLAGVAAAPQVLTSLVDGQYLQVYLESSDIKNRLFPDGKKFEQAYYPKLPDIMKAKKKTITRVSYDVNENSPQITIIKSEFPQEKDSGEIFEGSSEELVTILIDALTNKEKIL